MQGYFGDSISTRLSMTPEGFLVAQGARLCRSGWQFYRPSELGLSDSGPIEVYRPVDEVTAESFLASLNGKCVTDDHPGAFVDSTNASFLCRGHVQNVRVAPELVDGDVCIVGDLIATDEHLVNKIANGKRELSVGYTYQVTPNGDGTYTMHDLIANHVSVVTQGRAGSEIKIMDHAPSCHCSKELPRLARVADDEVECLVSDADIREINFGAAARRFLGKNIVEVAEQRKNR